jgi:phospholipid/cholesterol/gamma-HCH transport system substrate-binding protein
MSTARSEQTAETLVGAVVVAVAAAFVAFAMSNAGETRQRGGYALVAAFDRADGIATGSDVRLSGVKVGAVTNISLDPTTYKARVELALDPNIKVPDDSLARVATDGLLGGAHVSIDPGGSETSLAAGGEFTETQGSIDLLTVFASAMRQSNAGAAQGDAP